MEIDVSPELVIFRRKDREVRLEPAALFGHAGPSADRRPLLERFIAQGIQSVMNRNLFVRARVRLRVSNSFDALFHGYSRAVMRDAIFEAGAVDVSFVN